MQNLNLHNRTVYITKEGSTIKILADLENLDQTDYKGLVEPESAVFTTLPAVFQHMTKLKSTC